MFKSKPRYILLALAVSFVIFSLSVWLRNLPLLRLVTASPLFDFSDKLSIFFGFLAGVNESIGLFPSLLIIAMSLLFGANTALFIYYIRQRRRLLAGKGGLTIGAFIAGLFGIGCASCGSFLASSVLAVFGASSLIALLPLKGLEFAILSILLLSLSIYWLGKEIKNDPNCRL